MPKLPPNHVIGICYICREKIYYGTTIPIGLDGKKEGSKIFTENNCVYTEAAKLFHEQCKKNKTAKEIVRKMVINKGIT